MRLRILIQLDFCSSPVSDDVLYGVPNVRSSQQLGVNLYCHRSTPLDVTPNSDFSEI